MDLSPQSIHYFLEKYDIRNEQGLPIEFHERAFLWDIYADMSDKQVVLKAPQIGLTTLMLIKSFWVAKYKVWDIIYTLPTSSDVVDMAGGKINRILAQNPIFMKWTSDKDSVEQKAVGEARIYYRGTFTNRQAMMVASKLNIHDEVDASDQKVLVHYETRQQANKENRTWYFSHPSVVGNGVDKQWKLSDMKEWFITCPHCKKEQFLEFPDNLDMKRQCYICKECKGELADDDRRKGRWIPLHKDRDVSGYHISQMMCSWITAKKILDDYKNKDAQYFQNMVLGLPYADAGNTVTWDIIENSLREHKRKGRVIIGLDTGIDLRYVVGDKGGFITFGEVKSYEDFKRVMRQYPDCIVIADQGGDIIGIRSLQEEFPGRVFLCYFQQDRKSMQLIKWGEHEEFGKVIADRNRMIQLVVDEFNNRNYILNIKKDWHPYYVHWSHIYRLVEEDKITKLPKYVWHRNDRDDWVLATVYLRIGLDRFVDQDAEFLGGEDKEVNVPFAPYVDEYNMMDYTRYDQ